jgi:hypothetical protein
MAKRRKGLGSSASKHEDRLQSAAILASTRAQAAKEDAEDGKCVSAFNHLNIAELSRGRALAEIEGTERHKPDVVSGLMRKLDSAKRAFSMFCLRGGK